MKKEKCTYYDNGYRKKGFPGTKCYPVGCVVMTDKPIESLGIHYPLHPTALTWQDIRTIVNLADALVQDDSVTETEEEYYKAVLEAFNKTKK